MTETIAASVALPSGIALVVSLAPHALRWWRLRQRDARASDEREVRDRIHARETTERLLLRERDDHRGCREEVAEVRRELGDVRVELAHCQERHQQADERAEEEHQARVAVEKRLADVEFSIRRIERQSTPPQGLQIPKVNR